MVFYFAIVVSYMNIQIVINKQPLNDNLMITILQGLKGLKDRWKKNNWKDISKPQSKLGGCWEGAGRTS